MRSIRAIVSTGQGRLHLVRSAVALQQHGCDVTVISGWMPKRVPAGVVDLLGRVAKSDNLHRRLAVRRPPELPDDRLASCAFSEFAYQGLMLMSRSRMVDQSRALQIGWSLFGRESRRFLRGADVFHVRSGAGGGGAIRAARSRGMRVLVDHSIAHPSHMERVLVPVHRRWGLPFTLVPADAFYAMVLRDCEQADALLVNSDFVRESFIGEGYPAARIHVAYLGVREDFIGLKRAYRASSPPRLLFTGQFGLRKGAHVLLQALRRLDDRGFAYRLTVAGDDRQARMLLREFPVRGDVELLGVLMQDDLKSLLAESDLYVFPSLAEGSAQSAMEAMAAGLPVVVTPSTGLPVRHGEDGWTVPAGRDDSLAEAIEMLCADEALRERLGRRGAERIAREFTWKHYGAAVMNVYRRLLGH